MAICFALLGLQSVHERVFRNRMQAAPQQITMRISPTISMPGVRQPLLQESGGSADTGRQTRRSTSDGGESQCLQPGAWQPHGRLHIPEPLSSSSSSKKSYRNCSRRGPAAATAAAMSSSGGVGREVHHDFAKAQSELLWSSRFRGNLGYEAFSACSSPISHFGDVLASR